MPPAAPPFALARAVVETAPVSVIVAVAIPPGAPPVPTLAPPAPPLALTLPVRFALCDAVSV
jgi:hypothetical protein